MNIRLEPLWAGDIEDLRQWRNARRDCFFDTRIISQEQQIVWFWDTYTLGKCSRIYTVHLDNVRVGFIGFKRYSRYDAPIQTVEIGNLIMSPSHTGKGIMSAALSALRSRFQANTLWVAHVKPDNHASLRLFEKAGFIKLRPRRTSCRKSQS